MAKRYAKPSKNRPSKAKTILIVIGILVVVGAIGSIASPKSSVQKDPDTLSSSSAIHGTERNNVTDNTYISSKSNSLTSMPAPKATAKPTQTPSSASSSQDETTPRPTRIPSSATQTVATEKPVTVSTSEPTAKATPSPTAPPASVPTSEPTPEPTPELTPTPSPTLTPEPTSMPTDLPIIEVPQEGSVWIPTNGGSKFHHNFYCSGMVDPEYVTVDEARARGFEPCGRCYG